MPCMAPTTSGYVRGDVRARLLRIHWGTGPLIRCGVGPRVWGSSHYRVCLLMGVGAHGDACRGGWVGEGGKLVMLPYLLRSSMPCTVLKLPTPGQLTLVSRTASIVLRRVLVLHPRQPDLR